MCSTEHCHFSLVIDIRWSIKYLKTMKNAFVFKRQCLQLLCPVNRKVFDLLSQDKEKLQTFIFKMLKAKYMNNNKNPSVE